MYLAAGYAVTDNLSLGVNLNYNFGNIQCNFTAFQNGIQFGTRQIDRTDLSGFNLNFGLDYQRALSDNLNFYSAATYSPKMGITAKKIRNTATITLGANGSEVITSENNITFPDTDLSLPSQLTLGAGLGATNKWFIGAEYSNIQAEEFNFVTPDQDVNYQNASQYRLGGFYIPEYNSFTSYFNRIVYRAGIRFEGTGLQINNEDINEFGISFGVGLPAVSYTHLTLPTNREV